MAYSNLEPTWYPTHPLVTYTAYMVAFTAMVAYRAYKVAYRAYMITYTSFGINLQSLQDNLHGQGYLLSLHCILQGGLQSLHDILQFLEPLIKSKSPYLCDFLTGLREFLLLITEL